VTIRTGTLGGANRRTKHQMGWKRCMPRKRTMKTRNPQKKETTYAANLEENNEDNRGKQNRERTRQGIRQRGHGPVLREHSGRCAGWTGAQAMAMRGSRDSPSPAHAHRPQKCRDQTAGAWATTSRSRSFPYGKRDEVGTVLDRRQDQGKVSGKPRGCLSGSTPT